MKEILGKIITQITIPKSSEWILFEDNQGEKYFYVCEGECCAKCFIESTGDPEILIGASILKIEIKDIRTIYESANGFEVVEGWGYKIITSRGIYDIELRLIHNGYYGGELVYKKIVKKRKNFATRGEILESELNEYLIKDALLRSFGNKDGK